MSGCIIVVMVIITGELENSIFQAAYETKSDEELEFLKDAAERTNTVYRETIEFILLLSSKGPIIFTTLFKNRNQGLFLLNSKFD